MTVKDILKTKKVILDGALGTVLQKNGLAAVGALPEIVSITHSDDLIRIHKNYIEAGAQIVYANTFGANSYKLEGSGYTVQEIVSAAIKNAKKACEIAKTPSSFLPEQKRAFVALDIGPIGRLMQPNGDMTVSEAHDIFAEIIICGAQSGADCIVLETMTDLLEIKTALLAAKEFGFADVAKKEVLPVFCTMSFEANGRTFTGVTPAAAAVTLDALGADAIGINCSLGPQQVEPFIKEICAYTDKPVVVKLNAGLPDPQTNEYDVSSRDFANAMAQLLKYGVTVFGGCCGTTPEYIGDLSDAIQKTPKTKNTASMVNESLLCSFGKVVHVNRPLITGERINPTGKKLFKQALIEHDIDYILKQGLSQIEAQADILDVNVGIPGIDEARMLTEVVEALQSVTDVPLQIDTPDLKALESALRVYNGKPLVNSVNGEEKSLNTVLPLVKKYGAAVVCLTLDEKGIPQTAQERFVIAERIVKAADCYGIKRSDLYVDCLTLTVSAEQNQAVETLKALRMVKKEFGVKTTLGVSNISFGLPNRELITRTFLALALEAGLDLAIINPNQEAMSGTIRAYNVLHSFDESSREYVDYYKDWQAHAHLPKTASNIQNAGMSQKSGRVVSRNADEKNESELFTAVTSGLKTDAAEVTKTLIGQGGDPMAIVEGHLIPALDKVGKGFEAGRLFLPQLIQSATAAQYAFTVIRKQLFKNGDKTVSKGVIVLATVKGDIHDIGKNIVKVLLENYGYTVIDCGKNVSPQTIVQAVKEHSCILCGLSALMTTTLTSMKETIQLLRKEMPDCRIMVGGAVLTEDYAAKIGADFYGRDAQESVKYAKQILG
ncbi:MAG TPA: homocysteine S-methyltransferase family protein [Treponemataceae bacterium]|nr:homocysteine S-methyltransferase family protein [Treponemataceae bacterium]